MYITTNGHFVPANFIIHTFYDEKTCFCWNDDKLAIFPYSDDNSVSVEVLTAPAPIKSILCFSGRVFVVCMPQGVYKLSRDRRFAVLSKSAIGMGTVFYEVLVPRNKYLYLDNKQEMANKMLFRLSSEENDSSKLCICPLNAETATEKFLRTLSSNDSTEEHLCIIADGKKLLTLVKETVYLIHSSIYFIKNIIPVLENCKIDGLLLLTDTDVVIVMYTKDQALVFERISLGTEVQAVCASFSQLTKDTFWIVFSDESTLYYARKQLSVDEIQRMAVQDKSYTCLQCYDSKTILGLTTSKELVEFSIATVERTLSMENDTFIDLNSDMLKGTELIMNRIYQGTQELHALNEVLIAEEEKLRRINLYAHRHKIRLYPKLFVHRIANRLFLSANFCDMLPKNSWVVLNMKSEYRNTFCMKKVRDQETVVDIRIPEDKAANFSELAIDLITLKEAEHPWCLIRNYTNDPLPEKNKRRKRKSDKINFINSKIETLQSLIQEGNVELKKLSEIKRSIRKEFRDI